MSVVFVLLIKLLYMKNTLFIALVFLLFQAGYAQTATNFTCNDCSGVSHDLFTELDAGKVVVICWVMPCGACVGPSLTTHNVVQSFATTHPGKVIMYMADDFANTNCNSLTNWAVNNGITNATYFSNSAIDMFDYGTPGMPKVVVVGDVNHAVFFNANDVVNGNALQTAINTAITATLTGIDESADPFGTTNLYPNPAGNMTSLSFTLKDAKAMMVDIYNATGEKVKELVYASLTKGLNTIEISTEGFDNGLYFVKLSDGAVSTMVKLTVIR